MTTKLITNFITNFITTMLTKVVASYGRSFVELYNRDNKL